MNTTTSRRSFIFALTTATAATRTASRADVSDGEDYWNKIRRRFSFSEEKVPMNAANLCPSPASVSQRVAALTEDIDRDCSAHNRAKFADLLEESRRKTAALVGCSSDEVALVRNTSEANNIINNGLALRAGDEVVIWDQNHPTNNVAWDVRAARFGTMVKRVSTPARPESEDELIDPFRRSFSARTRVLAVTHVSNISGVRLPIRALCEEAHRRNIYVHVDGAQTWGALRVNLTELGCDSYAGSAHKWFLGPKEAGLLYVKQGRIASIWPGCVAPSWGADAEPDPRGARKFESLGQRDDACLAAVGTAADLHQEIGAEAIERRILDLSDRLKAGAGALGLELVTPRAKNLSGGVCIFNARADRRQEIFERLYKEFGIAGAVSGGIRLCPHIYNTAAHVGRALEGLKKMRELFV